MGLSAGFGPKYDFGEGFSIFANPYVQVHNIFHYHNDSEKICEFGLRLGLTYAL